MYVQDTYIGRGPGYTIHAIHPNINYLLNYLVMVWDHYSAATPDGKYFEFHPECA